MRNLQTEPLCEPEDLGKPIADCPHAVSVCLPLWEHVVGYEEGVPEIRDAMWCGYPRFVMHPQVQALHERLLVKKGKAGELCLSFISLEAAQRCQAFIGNHGRVEIFPEWSLAALYFPEEQYGAACLYRRHTGEMVSSRHAEAILAGRVDLPDLVAENKIKVRLGEWNGQEARDVFLYGSGMAAQYHLHQALRLVRGKGCSIQFGFPYVDILKVQQKFPPGGEWIADTGEAGFKQLRARLQKGDVMSVYAELPTNSLLLMPDSLRLSDLCREYEVPLLIDDTVGSYANMDSFRIADVTYSSLTKYFNGACDAMGGSIMVNRNSPFRESIHSALAKVGGDWLYAGDARVLEENSRDYPERMAAINRNAERVADFLFRHPGVERIHYPKFDDREYYETLLKPEGGYGGLLSIELCEPERNTPLFYNALKVSKGPSLGTNFTLVCPYTLLAHYEELDWAESCGISRWLIRVSVGLEPAEEICSRFARVLDGLPHE